MLKNGKLLNQIIKFVIVGFIATIIDWMFFYIFNEILRIHYLISGLVAFVCSFIFNYIFNIKWVFSVKKKINFLFQKYLILSLFGLVIQELILFVLVDCLTLDTLLSKIIATFFVMFYNFITRKKLLKSNL